MTMLGQRRLMLAMVGTLTVGKTMLGQHWPNTFKPTVTMPMLDQRRHKLHGYSWLISVNVNVILSVGPKSFANVISQRWPNIVENVGATLAQRSFAIWVYFTFTVK
jgi:hypothetical protein